MSLSKYQKQLNKIFKSHQVVLAYLFGSAARGRTGPLGFDLRDYTLFN